MKLSAITLSNFRGVSELRIPLDEKMTVLVGRNGIGKSSILDALAIMLTHVRSLWQAERPRLSYNIYNKSDVQIGRDD